MVKLHIKKFDISNIQDDNVIVAIGKRKSGKSYVVKDLLYYHRDIPVGTLVSGTEDSNKAFSSNIPCMFIHSDCTTELLEKVLRRQKVMMKRLQKELEEYGKSSLDPRAFVILDDCLHDSSWTRDKNMKYIFFNGRHRKLLTVITMQYPLGIPPNMRTNIDYVFIMRENNFQNRKRLYEAYAGMFPTFEMFCNVLDACTENFECLVIDNTVKSNKLQDQVFWYKAEDHGQYTMCCKSAWDLHNEIMLNKRDSSDEDSDGEQMWSPETFVKKNKMRLSVVKQ